MVFPDAGEYSKRATKPEILVRHLRFSPTGECVGRCYDIGCTVLGRQPIRAVTNDLCTVCSICVSHCF